MKKTEQARIEQKSWDLNPIMMCCAMEMCCSREWGGSFM